MVHEDSEFRRNVAFFEGHMVLIPISLVIPIWWLLNILTNHHRERLSNGRLKFSSRLWYCGPFFNFPLESLLKAVVCGIRFVLVFVVCIALGFPCNFHKHAQHMLLYVSLLAAALVELMTHIRCAHLPHGMDRLANVGSHLTILVIFVFHSGNSSPLNDMMHFRFVPYLCLANILALLLETIHPTSLVVALMRPYFATIIGFWFFQLGYTLFPVFPWQMPLDEQDPTSLKVVPLLFCFYLVLTLMMFLVLNHLVVWRLNRCNLPLGPLPYKVKHDIVKWTKCQKSESLLLFDENTKSHLSE